jgi:hypothetical protein
MNFIVRPPTIVRDRPYSIFDSTKKPIFIGYFSLTKKQLPLVAASPLDARAYLVANSRREFSRCGFYISSLRMATGWQI